MDRADTLREQASKFRELARTDKGGSIRDKLLGLASQCDDLARSIEAGKLRVGEARLRLVPKSE